MLLLTSAPTQFDNLLTLALVALLAIAVVVAVICKVISKKKSAAAPIAVPELTATEIPAAPGSAGQVKLHNVEPKTAAMLMAIVADRLGKPLNELRFISIKEVN